MASFNKTIITNNGRSLIAKVLSGDQIKFTKMVSSSRDYTSSDLSQLTDLSNVEQTIVISSIKKTSDSAVKITGIFSNKDLKTGYKFKTVGLYAIDPDLGEILYSVTTASSVDDMPANTGIGLSSITIGLVTDVSNSNNASLEVSDVATVSALEFNEFKDEVNSHLNDKASKNEVNDLATEKANQNDLDATNNNIIKSLNLIDNLNDNKLDKNDIITNIYKFIGVLATPDLAPTNYTGNNGDVYYIQSTNTNYAWNGTGWRDIGNYFLSDGSISTSKIRDYAITPQKTDFIDIVNLIKGTNIKDGYYISKSTGKEQVNSNTCATGFINVLENVVYSIPSVYCQLAYYDSNKSYVNGGEYQTDNSNSCFNITIPEGVKYIRLSFNLSLKESYIFCIGSSLVTKNYKLNSEIAVNSPNTNYETLYTLHKCYNDWCGGFKSPITWLGDSTYDNGDYINGVGYSHNTVGVDQEGLYVFETLLQNYLREECLNSSLRMYNAGFSSMTLEWANSKFDEIMTPFSDSKIVAIGYGINDTTGNNYNDYKKFYEQLEIVIGKCFSKGYQPVMITSAPTCEIGHIGRNAENQNSSCNSAKKDIAKKYNLEIIDLNEFISRFYVNSDYPLKSLDHTSLTYDYTHGDRFIHKFMADTLFAHIVPRTIWINKTTKIPAYVNKSKTDLTNTYLQSTIESEYKCKLYKENNTNSNVVLQDIWIYNNSDSKINLNCVGTGIVNVDGTKTTCNGNVVISNLEIGLHHVVVTSSDSTLTWQGIKAIVS
ncbi:SGNH/GDSL hydrolase family protein [Clostridium butyricum]